MFEFCRAYRVCLAQVNLIIWRAVACLWCHREEVSETNLEDRPLPLMTMVLDKDEGDDKVPWWLGTLNAQARVTDGVDGPLNEFEILEQANS
ncbi:hypothetical protein HAX54_020494 [Datura stramonium]|uniref:Uncharacterized protein n=1 Tax=Datura stramonium TaxID=4076 RepID=A0ABS8UR41_DATST|nr:hypothetical protein [Datura stramonium]